MDEFFQIFLNDYPIVAWLFIGGYLIYKVISLIANKMKSDTSKETQIKEMAKKLDDLNTDVEGVYEEIQSYDTKLREIEDRRYADMKLIQDSIKEMANKIDSNYEKVNKKLDHFSSQLVDLFKDVTFNNNK
jgi:peptidoglycan hydrolase CwlO-like protein